MARRQTERQRFVTRFSLRLEKGEASREELARAEANGVIAPQEKERLARLLEEHEERQRRKAADVARVTERLARGEKPDPSDPADRDAVEAHFESIAGGFADLPPEDRATALRDYVLRLGVMPDALVREFRGGLLSDNPAAQVFAAQQVAALEKENPALVADIPERERVLARTISEAALPGAGPELALKRAAEALTQKVPAAKSGEEDSADVLDRITAFLFGRPAAAAEPPPEGEEKIAGLARPIGQDLLTPVAGGSGPRSAGPLADSDSLPPTGESQAPAGGQGQGSRAADGRPDAAGVEPEWALLKTQVALKGKTPASPPAGVIIDPDFTQAEVKKLQLTPQDWKDLGNRLNKIVNPIPGGTIRNDRKGFGHFGARRGKRRHGGLDILAAPGTDVISPITGTVSKVAGQIYKQTSQFKYVEITGSGEHQGMTVRLFYVDAAGLPKGRKLKAGQTVIGRVQDIAAFHNKNVIDPRKRMKNHIEAQVVIGSGRGAAPRDPALLIRGWTSP